MQGSTMASDGSHLRIPSVDFRGLSLSSPGGGSWDAAREQLMSALESFGCFEAIYDAVSEGAKDQLFHGVLPELFKLPREIKIRNEYVGLPYHGYIYQSPHAPFDSLRIEDSPSLHSVQEFTSLMWPDGNPTFSNAAWTAAKQVQELELMVVRMILQSMDVEKHYDSLAESLIHSVRFSEYGIPFDQETKVNIKAHADANMLTVVCQYEVDGLEVQARDGEWIRVVSQPNSFTVMLGEAFQAWSNGRLRAARHRLRVTGHQTRCSVVFNSRPKDEILFQAPNELIDEDHPLRFRPYKYPDYVRLRFSTEGRPNHPEDPLQAYVGVEGQLNAA
ncbi:probable 2-oxoglutarate-dependent dioxygenase AOP1 [Zingiber officinale]|uniref:2-oxoglutarate-dependent dioxygenase DAO n=1 Tax=Zingiber officinale TaxID=94328 RepID=A0A8J5CTQ7_ZINOF|nr:probable 2-oxoglutarate-dependent dioxygenase AOP1 [Zingiber officinale]KAG6469219.1 hypothetical protein ZIOFF_073925 [Zingiber officinale]